MGLWDRIYVSEAGSDKIFADLACCIQSILCSEVSCKRMIRRQGFIYNMPRHRMQNDLFEARLIRSYIARRKVRNRPK